MSLMDWKKSVVYQIYPASFNDTTGNGKGDLRGIIEKLDYLDFLGVDYLWLTPIYESPFNDNGYDISNYYKVNEDFGTKEDFIELLEQAHARNIKIMMDIVINHTSTEHPWFLESKKSRDNKYRDYYIWRDGQDGPPTNWESKFGGNAWAYDQETDQYYLHLFDITQADLNWENEEMKQDIYEMINYWLELGVDGFRFDVINLISKDQYIDSPAIGKELYTDGPNVHQYLKELRENTFQDKDVMTVGEMSSTTIEECIKYTKPSRKELNSVFNFHHLKVDYPNGEKWAIMPYDFIELKRILMDWQVGIDQGNGWNAIFWCNHDQPRVVSRFGNDSTEPLRQKSAKMLAITLHCLKGTPYIYQGEEIGMTNPNFNSIDQYRDVESLNAYDIMLKEGKSNTEALNILKEKSRDNSRTPMQWSTNRHAGFTNGTPWIDVAENYKTINVAEAMKDEQSVLYTYKSLINLRHEHDILTCGSIEPLMINDESIFAYKRTYQDKELFCVANFSKEAVKSPYEVNDNNILIKNDEVIDDILEPYTAIVWVNEIKG